MALNSGKILMRRGQEVNFDPSKMTPGEWAVSLDSKYVRMCFSPGVCVRMATYDAFEADMEQMRNILRECKSIEEFVERVYNEIKDIVIDVERIELASANALKSEQNALNSANTASNSAEIATNKANEAIQNANTASVKAEQAINSAEIAVQKAEEAEVSADNSQNMSIQSQSYAVGGTGTREGEDTDNSKYYNEQSKSNAKRAEDAAGRAVAIAGVDIATVELAGLVKPDGDSIKILPDGTIYSNTPEIERKLEETTEKVNIIIQKAELNIKNTASGESIYLTDSADSKAVEFALYGKATQTGTPTPGHIVDIEVAGNDGNVIIVASGKNLLKKSTINKNVNGLDVIANDDGSITLNGTINNQEVINIIGSYGQRIPNNNMRTNVTISGYKTGCSIMTYPFINGVYEQSYSLSDYGNGSTKDWTNVDEYYVDIAVKAGTYNNLTIYPMIRLAKDTDSSYEPYKEITYIISTPKGLPGIKVDDGGNYTDDNGQQWVSDEIVKYADGTGEYIQRVNKVVFDGSADENWKKSGVTNNNSYYIVVDDVMCKDWNLMGLMCNRFTELYMNTLIYSDAVGCSYGVPDGHELRLGFGLNSFITSADLLKQWLATNNVEMLYMLENPIIKPLTSEQITQIEKLHTFYPVTNISNDADCGMKVKYNVDSKNYIDNKLALQAKAREEEMMNMLLLLPEEIQAKMIENDTNNLLTESEE